MSESAIGSVAYLRELAACLTPDHESEYMWEATLGPTDGEICRVALLALAERAENDDVLPALAHVAAANPAA